MRRLETINHLKIRDYVIIGNETHWDFSLFLIHKKELHVCTQNLTQYARSEVTMCFPFRFFVSNTNWILDWGHIPFCVSFSKRQISTFLKGHTSGSGKSSIFTIFWQNEQKFKPGLPKTNNHNLNKYRNINIIGNSLHKL